MMARRKEVDCAADMQSIMNNFKVIPDERMDAARMKFCLRRLKLVTGMSEQALMLRMLFFAFDNSSEYDPVRDRIVKEWQSIENGRRKQKQ